MAVLIMGMEMPKEPDELIEIAIFGDGKVIQTGESWRNPENGKCYYATTTPENFFNAVTVPPHGDLIDRDAAAEKIWDDMRFPCNLANAQFFVNELREMPTIIPADQLKEET